MSAMPSTNSSGRDAIASASCRRIVQVLDPPRGVVEAVPAGEGVVEVLAPGPHPSSARTMSRAAAISATGSSLTSRWACPTTSSASRSGSCRARSGPSTPSTRAQGGRTSAPTRLRSRPTLDVAGPTAALNIGIRSRTGVLISFSDRPGPPGSGSSCTPVWASQGPTPHGPADLGTLVLGDRVRERDAMEPLDHLRTGSPQPEGEPPRRRSRDRPRSWPGAPGLRE